MTYAEFFRDLTDHPAFPYQERLAQEPWPEVLDIPTGLGKTAAVAGAWLWKRLQQDSETGRRLVYCLPMRVLVDQTYDAISALSQAASPRFRDAGHEPPSVHKLMGGFVEDDWERCPDLPAVLIGTQDMLLSRALNRGYAMSRYKWPVHFSLLNNDCLWVFDETQLAGVGVETSAQLQAFRDSMGTHGGTRTVWMSATVGTSQLNTVDHPEPDDGWTTAGLGDADMEHETVRARTGAVKPLSRLEEVLLDKDSAKKGYVEALADRVRQEHQSRGGLTLVVLNRVERAQRLFSRLHGAAAENDVTVTLIHSRFRGADRERHERVLHQRERPRIVVATQAVEAGVDVSARTLITELAPWPALVQRFGRCNRYGGDKAAIFWTDIDTADSKSDLPLPYAVEDLDVSRELLSHLEQTGGDAGPSRLRELSYEPPPVVRPVLRRRDLTDLFDTTPDLSGNDVDVSRYVRDGQDTDVHVYWRSFEGAPSEAVPAPGREELCRVSFGAARAFLSSLDKHRRKLAGGTSKDRDAAQLLRAWRWDPLAKAWAPVSQVFPGQVLLLHPDAGGYDVDLGWTGEVAPKEPPPPAADTSEGETGDSALDSDPRTFVGRWVLLRHHLGHVRDEAATLAEELALDRALVDAVVTAGLWHDVGKAHEAFQHKLLAPVADDPVAQPAGPGPWAKSNHRRKADDTRKHFRHELASALAWLQYGEGSDVDHCDLIAYLVAAHHGKVRLSIRSLPGETEPQDSERPFARGVWHGDTLEPFDLPDGRRLEDVRLDLSLVKLGEGSWLERMIRLRDTEELGPFRLALLETVVRVADWRASRKEQEGVYDDT